MAMKKIYSQASNDVVIPTYEAKEEGKDVTGANRIKKAIIIKGGANVAFGDPARVQRNPKWIMTEVTDEELKVLESNPAFKRKVERGFITVGKEPAALKADKSAQLTEKQVKAKNPKATIKTGKAEE